MPSVQARVTSIHGPIAVSWAYAAGALTMTIDVPVDVSARVMVPATIGGGAATVTVTEGGNSVWSQGTVRFLSSSQQPP